MPCGLLLDVHNTVLEPARPVEQTYLEIGRPFGVEAVDFAGALAAVAGRVPMRGDGRAFWREVVARATGSTDPDLFEALYAHFARPEAWRVAGGFAEAADRLRAAGWRVAFLSNADARLRPLLDALGLLRHVDAAVISAEEGVEKPARAAFDAALRRLGVPRERAIHVGDSPRDDVLGARRAGLAAWRWGGEVRSMPELARRLLAGEGPCPATSR